MSLLDVLGLNQRELEVIAPRKPRPRILKIAATTSTHGRV
jgi:hypothetical protein